MHHSFFVGDHWPIIHKQQAQIEALTARVRVLEKTLELKGKTSLNSSVPPPAAFMAISRFSWSRTD